MNTETKQRATREPFFAGSNATVAGIVVEKHGKPTIIQVTAREAAAAPELLAALTQIDEFGTLHDGAWCAKIARAAIAKATS